MRLRGTHRLPGWNAATNSMIDLFIWRLTPKSPHTTLIAYGAKRKAVELTPVGGELRTNGRISAKWGAKARDEAAS